MDFLEQVSAGWHKMHGWPYISQSLVELVRNSWDGPHAIVRQQAIDFVQPFVRQPRRLLVVFDQVKSCGLGPLAQLSNVFQLAANYAGIANDSPQDREVLVPMIRDLLTNRPAYGYTRAKVLGFCLEQAVSPESIAWFAAQWHVRLRDRTRLDEHLAADKVLTCTYQALRLFSG